MYTLRNSRKLLIPAIFWDSSEKLPWASDAPQAPCLQDSGNRLLQKVKQHPVAVVAILVAGALGCNIAYDLHKKSPTDEGSTSKAKPVAQVIPLWQDGAHSGAHRKKPGGKMKENGPSWTPPNWSLKLEYEIGSVANDTAANSTPTSAPNPYDILNSWRGETLPEPNVNSSSIVSKKAFNITSEENYNQMVQQITQGGKLFPKFSQLMETLKLDPNNIDIVISWDDSLNGYLIYGPVITPTQNPHGELDSISQPRTKFRLWIALITRNGQRFETSASIIYRVYYRLEN